MNNKINYNVWEVKVKIGDKHKLNKGIKGE